MSYYRNDTVVVVWGVKMLEMLPVTENVYGVLVNCDWKEYW